MIGIINLCLLINFFVKQSVALAVIVPLNDNLSNIDKFVDSLFSDNVRDFNSYRNHIFKKKKDRFFFSPKDTDKIIKVFLNVWFNKKENNNSKCPKSDRALLEFLKNYIKKNGLVMFKPKIEFHSTDSKNVPIYKISGYQKYDPLKNFEDAKEFLELFLAGAHFVVIDGYIDSSDNYDGSSCLDDLVSDPIVGSLTSSNLGNSHYTSTMNFSGINYLNISQDEAINPSPFINSFIAAQTSFFYPNTFMQLEGWPASLLHHYRHQKDYVLHKASLWNISTYGASAYSEKRATAIFFAKPEWDPKLQTDTIMPKYRGAETPQTWLKKDLVIIDQSE